MIPLSSRCETRTSVRVLLRARFAARRKALKQSALHSRRAFCISCATPRARRWRPNSCIQRKPARARLTAQAGRVCAPAPGALCVLSACYRRHRVQFGGVRFVSLSWPPRRSAFTRPQIQASARRWQLRRRRNQCLMVYLFTFNHQQEQAEQRESMSDESWDRVDPPPSSALSHFYSFCSFRYLSRYIQHLAEKLAPEACCSSDKRHDVKSLARVWRALGGLRATSATCRARPASARRCHRRPATGGGSNLYDAVPMGSEQIAVGVDERARGRNGVVKLRAGRDCGGVGTCSAVLQTIRNRRSLRPTVLTCTSALRLRAHCAWRRAHRALAPSEIGELSRCPFPSCAPSRRSSRPSSHPCSSLCSEPLVDLHIARDHLRARPTLRSDEARRTSTRNRQTYRATMSCG